MIFAKFDGEIIEREDYIVFKTLTNPNYYWGNILLFKNPPFHKNLNEWKNLFKEEFKEEVYSHYTFAWDTDVKYEDRDLSQFLADGFILDQAIVLTSQKVHQPPKYNQEIEVRPLSTPKEWEDAIKVQVDNSHVVSTKQNLENFYRAQMKRYQKMVENKMGFWFGAFLGDVQVANLGIFTDGELARFQLVATHPEYQRQGICGSLVYQSARFAFLKMGVDSLIMVADENYHAAKIYESVGFIPTEKLSGVYWYPKSSP